jgi:hypothetical protein
MTNPELHANKVLWDPACGRIYTFLDSQGFCRYFGGSFDDLQQKGSIGPAAVVIDLIEALELQYAAQRAEYCTGPRAVGHERFWEALECLPPENWVRMTGCETFRMSERMSGSIAIFYVRIGDATFEICEDEDTTHSELVKMVYDLPAYCGVG